MGSNGKEQIGDYELIDLIGDGAQGRVYRARCLVDTIPNVPRDDVVAIKVLRIVGDDEKLRAKFQQQADILRRLSHTNIVSYRDCFAWHQGEWDEAQCLVMELLEGETLQDRLKKASAGLPWPQVEEIFEQCLAGLIHARERGITHRDLKPSNLFITKDGVTKVIDFDIARRDDSGQISTAGWKGTFDYMAPDFISITGFRGDEVSDIFSLGVCFYQALTGSLPYDPLGDSAHIGYLNRWRDGAAPAPSFRPGVFRVLSGAKPFVQRCLASKREERYQSFAAMLEDFRKIRYRRIRHKNKDEYELLAVLGRGGFGEVFKARKVSDGSLVAVKYLFADRQSDRFIKEAKIVQHYSHPNLVKYVDFLVVEGTGGEKQYFLILEFLEGMPGWSLRTRLKNEGKLEVAEVIPLFCGYLSALQFLHENSRPIIHRDIKPGNLYAPVGQPDKGKIFDLGVARDVTGTVTVGGVPGTLDYMPPEFAEAGGDRGSPQSDIYALGLCLYEALAGRPVYERLPTDMNSAWLAFQQRLRAAPPVVFESEAFTQYPRLKDAILKAIADKPGVRYRSAAEMRQHLEVIFNRRGEDQQRADDLAPAEMTMATLHTVSAGRPEPGATLGTRPLDAVGGTQVAPVDLIAAGKAEAERRKRRKRLTLIGAAAGIVLGVAAVVGVVLAVRGGSAEREMQNRERLAQDIEQSASALRTPVLEAAYVRKAAAVLADAVKLSEKYPEMYDRLSEQRRALRKALTSMPVEFRKAFDAASLSGRKDTAAALMKEWQALESECGAMDLSAAQYVAARDAMQQALGRSEMEREMTRVRDGIPATIMSARDWTSAEDAAARLKEWEGQAWPGFTDVEKARALADLSSRLTGRATPYVVLLRDAALAKYGAGQNGDAELQALRALATSGPRLTLLVQAGYDEALKQVEAARDGQMAAQLLTAMLDRANRAKDLNEVRAVETEFRALESSAAGRLPTARVKSMEDALGARYLSIGQDYAQRAKDDYAALRVTEGAARQKMLSDLAASVPERLSKSALVRLEQEVEAARTAAQAKGEQDLAARTRELQDAGRSLADLRAAIRKGDVRDCKDVLRLLTGFAPAVLADAGFKAQWDAAAGELADLAEKSMAPTEPLDQRLQRIQTVEALLSAPGAEKVFHARLRPLQDQLALQKSGCAVRLVNRTGQSIQVTGRELKETIQLPANATRDLTLSVGATPIQTSFRVEGGAGTKPRVEPVTLTAGGGHEWIIGPLDKAPVAPAATATVAVAAASAAPPAAPLVIPAGKGLLEIAVTPRNALITVDGNRTQPGPVEVTADENHRVTIELPGYKSCEQYYRVKSGERRKIDILLEKAPKKSFFTF